MTKWPRCNRGRFQRSFRHLRCRRWEVEEYLQRHNIKLYLAAVAGFPSNFSQAAKIASVSELSSFLTPSVDAIETVRSYTSMTVLVRGTNLGVAFLISFPLSSGFWPELSVEE